MTRFYIAACYCVAISLPGAVIAQDPSVDHPSRGRAMLEDVVSSRLNMRSFHAMWENEVLSCRDAPAVEGAHHKFDGWFDFAANQARVARKSSVPQLPELTRHSRFAFNGGRFLIVNGDDVTGRELVGMELDHAYSSKAGTVYSLSTDIRWLGILPVHYSQLKNYPGEKAAKLILSDRCIYTTDEVELESRHVTLVTQTSAEPEYRIRYWIDENIGLPVKVESDRMVNGDRARREVIVQWGDGIAAAEMRLPEVVASRSWIQKSLDTEDLTKVTFAEFGVTIPRELFEWPSMEVPDGFVVRAVDGVSRTTKEWDAAEGAFKPWEPEFLVETPHIASSPLPVQSNSRGRLFLALNLSLGTVLLLYFAYRRRKASSAAGDLPQLLR